MKLTCEFRTLSFELKTGHPPLLHSAIRNSQFAILVWIATLALGCATEHRPPLLTAPEPPIVWPAPPDAPRVRYVGQIKGSTDLHPQKSFGQICDEVLHGPTQPSMLVTPYAIAVHPDGIRFAVADTGNACVHLFNLQTQGYERKEFAGTPPRRFESPVAIAWIGETIWVADARLHGLAVLDTQAASATPSSGHSWIGIDQLKRPSGLVYCPQNGLVYVSDAGAHCILAFEANGRLALQFGSKGSGEGQFNCPAQLACGTDSLFVIDALNSRVQCVGLDGSPMGIFGRKGDAAGDLALPKGVAVGPEGNLWIVDAQFENVQAFTHDGRLLMAFGQEGHAPGEFWLPAGACIDNRNRLWVADSYNQRVQVFQLLP